MTSEASDTYQSNKEHEYDSNSDYRKDVVDCSILKLKSEQVH